MQKYVADRDFNEIHKGQVLEMEDGHPYLSTGYLVPFEEVEELPADERPVAEEVVGSTAQEDWDAENADEEVATDGVEGEGEAGSKPRARRRSQ